MRILVIGDYILDKYTFGAALRLCPEAPVPVLIPQLERESCGGAGLVHAQLRELGADAVARFGSRSIKHRYFAGNHLLCRVDQDSIQTGWDAPLEPSLDWAEAIVVADYGKGAMADSLPFKIIRTGKPIFVDAKHNWEEYTHPFYLDYSRKPNATLFPNEHEAMEASLYDFCRIVRKRGAHGACLDQPNGFGVDAVAKDVVDVTGAGDIFMAAFVYGWSVQLPAEDCLRFANACAGESCRHVGTYVVPQHWAKGYLNGLRTPKTETERIREDSEGQSQAAAISG